MSNNELEKLKETVSYYCEPVIDFLVSHIKGDFSAEEALELVELLESLDIGSEWEAKHFMALYEYKLDDDDYNSMSEMTDDIKKYIKVSMSDLFYETLEDIVYESLDDAGIKDTFVRGLCEYCLDWKKVGGWVSQDFTETEYGWVWNH